MYTAESRIKTTHGMMGQLQNRLNCELNQLLRLLNI